MKNLSIGVFNVILLRSNKERLIKHFYYYYSKRYCWVCFASDEDDATASWVKPCNCRGTTKWVHQGCIQRWVDEKQKDRSGKHVSCPQCNTEYIIVYPNMGKSKIIFKLHSYSIFHQILKNTFIKSFVITKILILNIKIMMKRKDNEMLN